MDTINLVVLNDSNVNKYISLLRKKTFKSISDIKQSINMGFPVIECNYYDAEGLELFIVSTEELFRMGASLKIYENKKEITLEMVKNLIGTIEGIAQDREEMDKNMFGDDD